MACLHLQAYSSMTCFATTWIWGRGLEPLYRLQVSEHLSYISYHLALYINLSIVHRVMLRKKEVT